MVDGQLGRYKWFSQSMNVIEVGSVVSIYFLESGGRDKGLKMTKKKFVWKSRQQGAATAAAAVLVDEYS